MNRKALLMVVLISIISMSAAFAQKEGFGIGIMVGEPTGISAKVGIPFAIGVAWSVTDEANYHFHLDLLSYVSLFRRHSNLAQRVPFYHGVGVRMKLREDKDLIGIRLPLGVSYVPERLPIDIFFEVVPIVDIVPEFGFGINSAIGARVFF